MTENSLINLGELSKPATVLVEKISDAVGGIFKPYQMVRVARAEAEVERIRAKTEIEITDLHRRAMLRFLEEEAKKQANMESITGKALPLLGADSSPDTMENDWITNFFDKGRLISDDEMQRLWSRVLAGEANSPGTFSKRTVNLLSDLEKGDAQLFTALCGFQVTLNQSTGPLVYDFNNQLYVNNGVYFAALGHLDTLGLIQFSPLAGFTRTRFPKTVTASYYGRTVELNLAKESDNIIEVGYVFPTKAGLELARVCGGEPVAGFLDFLIEHWSRLSYAPNG